MILLNLRLPKWQMMLKFRLTGKKLWSGEKSRWCVWATLFNASEKRKGQNIQSPKSLLEEIKYVTPSSPQLSQEKPETELGLFRKNIYGVVYCLID